jgi:hypothetical protein
MLLLSVGVSDTTGSVCRLQSKLINESSGVAASLRRPNVFWTHNDSGDKPRFFAFDAGGKDLGTYELSGANAVDWEDMASRRVGGKNYLYFGDIGDNARRRKSIVIYRVEEPALSKGEHVLHKFDSFICEYPDAAQDCEALLVTPQGDVQLVTKSLFGDSNVYFARLKGKKIRLVKLTNLDLDAGSLGGNLVTGGAMSLNSDKVVIRTYADALLFVPKKGQKWYSAKPVHIPLAEEAQGEAVCFDPKANRLITTSEGSPCRVSFARLP